MSVFVVTRFYGYGEGDEVVGGFDNLEDAKQAGAGCEILEFDGGISIATHADTGRGVWRRYEAPNTCEWKPRPRVGTPAWVPSRAPETSAFWVGKR